MTTTQLPDELVQNIVLKTGGSWGDATPEDREFFRRFASFVAAYEREECAKVCEEQMKAYMSSQYTTDPLGGFRERFAAEKCADAIRAKGQK